MLLLTEPQCFPKLSPVGRFKLAKKKVKLVATTATGVDSDILKLTCVPRGWPSHGYDRRNSRATPLETVLSPANASGLVQKWNLDLQSATRTVDVLVVDGDDGAARSEAQAPTKAQRATAPARTQR